jgi:putative hemolysin
MNDPVRPFSFGEEAAGWRRPMIALAGRALGLRRLQQAHATIDAGLGDAVRDPSRWLDAAVAWLGLDVELPAGDIDRVPAAGAAIVVAEHPTGAMEGLLLLAVLRRRRPDVKVLANRWLMQLPALRDLVLPVDVFDRGNMGAVREALRHLRRGGLLLAFPAGAVATRPLLRRKAREGRWQETFAGLQRRAEVPVVPVHVGASNPWWFHAAGAVHRHLRTALLGHALLAQRHSQPRLRIGHAIPPSQLERFGDDDRSRADYLRLRTEILARRTAPSAPTTSWRTMAKIASRGSVDALANEIGSLPATALLASGNGMQVFCATADQLPQTLAEIGRLREITFRAAGEGSGLPRDLDRFDPNYRHLFVWDPAAREIVGAYRVGLTDELLARGGPSALYTSEFYDFAPEVWSRLSPALELGRSFVQPRYQKGFAPLLLLWRGLGAFVAAAPRYHRLFGPVSIAADHHATSVRLMIDHLQSHCLASDLAPFVHSRRPWRAQRREAKSLQWEPQQIAQLHDVSAMVRELEVGRAGVPVLLEQYLKLGAKLLGVNVDPDFHTIDALMLVDLLHAPTHLQQRYLGAEGVQALHQANATATIAS